jgi:single-stranded-DNA-specific exonuclease
LVDSKISVTGKIWDINTDYTDLPLFERLCKQKKLITQDDCDAFFVEAATAPLHDALLLKDIHTAIERIKKAVDTHERVLIYGDYDVDGISGTAVMYKALMKIGAQVSYRLPHRAKDGYGLNINAIDECIKVQAGLLITVDCGSSNASEIAYAAEQGIDTIIIDHHSIPTTLPTAATAFINPHREDCKYPFNDLSGSAVAYKVALALLDAFDITDKKLREELLHLASLGVVADCVPLLGENRNILKRSFLTMGETRNNGLRALFSHNSVDTQNIDTFTIGFVIGPRINAPGRLATPYYSIELLLGKTAKLLTVEDINTHRKQLVSEYLIEAEKQKNDYKTDKCIVVYSDNWHLGVIGLLAGKLTEKYNVPTIALQKKGDEYVASARAPEYFNLMEPLHSLSDLFVKYGGHHQAAGLSLHKNNLENFVKQFCEHCRLNIDPQNTTPRLRVDAELSADDLSLFTINKLQTLAPFGMKNPAPRFVISHAMCEQARPIGVDGKHLKTLIRIGNHSIDGIGFHLGHIAEQLNTQPVVDMVGSLEKNEWQGNVKAQFRIEDIRF